MLLTADEPTEALMAFLSKRAGVLARGIFEVSILSFSHLAHINPSFYPPSYHHSCLLFCRLSIFVLASIPVSPFVSFSVNTPAPALATIFNHASLLYFSLQDLKHTYLPCLSTSIPISSTTKLYKI